MDGEVTFEIPHRLVDKYTQYIELPVDLFTDDDMGKVARMVDLAQWAE